MTEKKMVQIELTEDAYSALLCFKNFITIKLSEITNPEVVKLLNESENQSKTIREVNEIT